jgi:predicted Fe-Mo cluster-binding NifX family protein
MKICFAVQKDEGLESKVYNHFSSASMFVVINTKTNEMSVISNRDTHHMHGACNPTKALDGQRVDAIVVGGIGSNALNRLNQAGIRVYQARALTIKDNIAMLRSQSLPEFRLQQCCSSHGGGCNH